MPEASDARKHARKAIATMDDNELELGELSMRAMALTLINHSLLEGMKGQVWLQVGSCASSGIAGLFTARFLADEAIWAVALGLVGAVVICFGGALWHRRRAIDLLGQGHAVEDRRDEVRAELRRRGLFDD